MGEWREHVVVIGGPLDGLEGHIGKDASRQGFFLYEEGEWWYGYFAHETRLDGRRVFRPGPRKAET